MAVAGLHRTVPQPAALVDETAVADGEDPGSEVGLVALEVGDTGEGPEEDLADEILGLSRPLHPQVTSNRSRQLVEEPLEGPPALACAARRMSAKAALVMK